MVVLAALACLVAMPPAHAAPGNGSSTATITGAFSDDCREFSARSTKDISHVAIHYADGRVVRDETIDSHEFSIKGDEIAVALVKSGTTTEDFECEVQTANSPPTALLEVEGSSTCTYFAEFDQWACLDARDPRDVWLSGNRVLFGCDETIGLPPCNYTFSFRGTGSSDPDNDIVSWSIEFADPGGATTTVSGDWATDPPDDVELTVPFGSNAVRTVTLTVTDSAGQTSSDTMLWSLSQHD